MEADHELAEISRDFERWHIWRGRDHHGQTTGWHATLRAPGRTVILAGDGAGELRHRLEQVEAHLAAAGETP